MEKNVREDLAIKLLKDIKLYKYFDFIAGADTFEYRKPDPRHLTNILDILEIDKKNTIMLGDSETDANTAKAADIHFVLIKDGYTEKNLEDIHHDHLIEDFEVVKDIASNYINLPSYWIDFSKKKTKRHGILMSISVNQLIIIALNS